MLNNKTHTLAASTAFEMTNSNEDACCQIGTYNLPSTSELAGEILLGYFYPDYNHLEEEGHLEFCTHA